MSLVKLFDERLPINRKERYYTGTVLPGIVAQDNLRYFGRFLHLLKLDGLSINASPQAANIQFMTEYGFTESVFDPVTRARFPNSPPDRDTPDIQVFIDGPVPVLVAIEAKMFDRISAVELHAQIERQGMILRYLANLWDGVHIVQAALLPEALAKTLSLGSTHIITWEAVLDAYRDVPGTDYFRAILASALARYTDLRAIGSASQANADATLSGTELVSRFQNGDTTYQTMGRNRGFDGKWLAADAAEGSWKTRIYEVRSDPVPINHHWFPISSFVALVT